MIKADLVTLPDHLRDKWESKYGFCLVVALFLFLYFVILKFFIDFPFQLYWIWTIIVIPSTIIVINYIWWLFSTNRFVLRFNDDIISAGIILFVDEEKEKLVISKILNKVLRYINSQPELSNVKLRNLPSNFCDSPSAVLKYYEKHSSFYDIIISIRCVGGKYDSIEKIFINELSIAYTPKYSSSRKHIYYDEIEISKEIELQVKARNWEFKFENSGIDKKKYFDNLYDLILYYIVIYAIYVDRFTDSLEILKLIFKQEKTKIPIHKGKDGKLTLNLNRQNIAEGRLAAILVDLYFHIALKAYYDKSDVRKALEYFLELDKILKNHPQKYSQYISMARFSYELGNFSDAIKFTQEANKIKPNTTEIYLNFGFFAIFNNDIPTFCANYREIFNLNKNLYINWVEVVSFQIKESEKHPDKFMYFKFSIAFIEYIMLGQIDAKYFKKIVDDYQHSEKYRCIYLLGLDILKKKKR